VCSRCISARMFLANGHHSKLYRSLFLRAHLSFVYYACISSSLRVQAFGSITFQNSFSRWDKEDVKKRQLRGYQQYRKENTEGAAVCPGGTLFQCLTGHFDCLGFRRSLQENAGTSIRPWLLFSRSFPIHH
jgi:hypothetical protein